MNSKILLIQRSRHGLVREVPRRTQYRTLTRTRHQNEQGVKGREANGITSGSVHRLRTPNKTSGGGFRANREGSAHEVGFLRKIKE